MTMSDDDLIRRGQALERLELAEHDAEERDWRSGANEIARLRKYVAAIPAVQPTVKPLGADGVTIHPQDILNAAWRDDLGEEGLAMYARILSALNVQPTVKPDVVALVEALEYYADQFCEGFCQDFPSAGYTDEKCELDCGGCKARAALARVKGVM